MTDTFRASLFYVDPECGGSIHSVVFECAGSSRCTDAAETCNGADNFDVNGFTWKFNCTTDRSQQLDTAFGGEQFLSFDTVKDVSICADSSSNEINVTRKAILADGVFDPAQNASLKIDTASYALLTINIVNKSRFTRVVSKYNASILLSPEFLADPYCVVYDNSSYSFVAAGSGLPNGTERSYDESGIVYYTYGDNDCSGAPGSIFIGGHASCVESFGEDGLDCTRTITGDDEYYFRVGCLDTWIGDSDRKSVLDEAFEGVEYLAFDVHNTSESDERCSFDTLKYTYAYAADGWYHYGFDHDQARVNLRQDGSASVTRSKCVDGVSCEADLEQFELDPRQIGIGFCVVASGSEKYEVYSNAEQINSRGKFPITAAVVGSMGGLLLVITSITLWRWYRRRRQMRSKPRDLQVSLVEADIDARMETPPPAKSPSTIRAASGASVVNADGSAVNLWDDPVIISSRLPREKVILSDVLSRGGYGEVFVGTFNGQLVAIKMLYRTSDEISLTSTRSSPKRSF